MFSLFISFAVLLIAYFTYGKLAEKVFSPDGRPTPAVSEGDGVDFVPMKPWRAFLIQLLNIAGTGPILGALMGAVNVVPVSCGAVSLILGVYERFINAIRSLNHKNFKYLYRGEVTEFSRRTDRQTLASLAHDIGPDTGKRSADWYVRLLHLHFLADGIDGRLRRAIGIDEAEPGRSETGEFLSSGIEDFQGRIVREIECVLSGHLRGHQEVRDMVSGKESIQGGKVQADFIRNDVQGGSGSEAGGKVTHAGVEAETGIGCCIGIQAHAQGQGIAPSIDGDVAVAELYALGDSGRTAGVQ